MPELNQIKQQIRNCWKNRISLELPIDSCSISPFKPTKYRNKSGCGKVERDMA